MPGESEAATGQITQGDDPDHTLVAVDDRQTAHLLLGHVVPHVAEILVLEHVFDALGGLGSLPANVPEGAGEEQAIGDLPMLTT